MNDLVQKVDCLTQEELDLVLGFIDREVTWQGTTVFGYGGTARESEVRTGTRFCMDDSHFVTETIHNAMNRALLEYAREVDNVDDAYINQWPQPGAFGTNSNREGIQLLKYETGQFYHSHYDMSPWRQTQEHNRTHSIVLYLNEEFTGGRTIFPHRAFKPKAGQALIFPSNWCYPHRCEVINSGTKLAAVTWYYAHYDNG
jgi:hypothetical protein